MAEPINALAVTAGGQTLPFQAAPAASTEFRKLDVTVRETDYVAGKRSLTAIVIRNTYPTPIKLTSVAARHSMLTRLTVARYIEALLNSA